MAATRSVAKKKSILQEIFSKALYADDLKLYSVVYRDMNRNRQVSLEAFIELSEGFTRIPAWRIIEVKREGVTIYRAKR